MRRTSPRPFRRPPTCDRGIDKHLDVVQEIGTDCPYCGECISLLVDGSAGEQRYVEDCEVCCKPMVVCCSIAADGGLSVVTRHEDEVI